MVSWFVKNKSFKFISGKFFHQPYIPETLLGHCFVLKIDAFFSKKKKTFLVFSTKRSYLWLFWFSFSFFWFEFPFENDKCKWKNQEKDNTHTGEKQRVNVWKIFFLMKYGGKRRNRRGDIKFAKEKNVSPNHPLFSPPTKTPIFFHRKKRSFFEFNSNLNWNEFQFFFLVLGVEKNNTTRPQWQRRQRKRKKNCLIKFM